MFGHIYQQFPDRLEHKRAQAILQYFRFVVIVQLHPQAVLFLQLLAQPLNRRFKTSSGQDWRADLRG